MNKHTPGRRYNPLTELRGHADGRKFNLEGDLALVLLSLKEARQQGCYCAGLDMQRHVSKLRKMGVIIATMRVNDPQAKAVSGYSLRYVLLSQVMIYDIELEELYY